LIAVLLAVVVSYFFTIQTHPFALLAFSNSLILPKGPVILANSCIFALFCTVMCLGYVSGRFKFAALLLKSAFMAIWMFAISGFNYMICDRFTIPEYTYLGAEALIVVLVALVYFKSRKRYADKVSSSSIRKSAVGSGQIRYAYNVLYASLTIMMVISVAMFIASAVNGGNISIPFFLAAILLCFFLWRVLRWRGILLPAIAVAAFGLIVSGIELSLVNSALLVALSDIYCRKEQNI